MDPGVSWEKVGIRKAPHLLIQEFILPVFWQTQSDSASRGSSGSMGWPSSSRVEKLVPNSKAKKITMFFFDIEGESKNVKFNKNRWYEELLN